MFNSLGDVELNYLIAENFSPFIPVKFILDLNK